MKLDIFNPWRDLDTWSGITIQYQTTKKGDSYITYMRDKASKQPITFGLSRSSKEEAQERAIANIKKIGIDGIKRAIETGQMIRPDDSIASQSQPRDDIEWRDGSNHRFRAQRKIVDQR